MKFVLEEKDESFIEKLIRDLSEGEDIPLFVNGDVKTYSLEFGCTDIAKANMFVFNMMSRNNEEIEDTLGIRVKSLNYHGDRKVNELKEMLKSFLEQLENM